MTVAPNFCAATDARPPHSGEDRVTSGADSRSIEAPVAAALPVDRRSRTLLALEANGLMVGAVAVVALLAIVLALAAVGQAGATKPDCI